MTPEEWSGQGGCSLLEWGMAAVVSMQDATTTAKEVAKEACGGGILTQELQRAGGAVT